MNALQRLFAPAVLCFAAACVSTAPDPLKEPPKSGESIVVVSITGNTAQVSAIDAITVQRTPDATLTPELHVLKQVSPGLARDTSLFIGVLPAGEYEFARFNNAQTRQYLALSASMRSLLGRFTVRGGQPIDLGRLVMTPVNTKVIVGRSARAPSNLPLMRRFAAEHARLVEGTVGPGWNGSRSNDDRVEEYALARPVGADNPIEARDGTIYAASRLGSVLVRTPAGRWQIVRSGKLEALLYATPVDLPDATLVAAGEFSTLVKLPRTGNQLVPIDTGDLPPGNLFYVGGNDVAGWYLAHQHTSTMTLFHSPKLEGGRWRALRSESIAVDFWSGPNAFWIWNTPRGLAYAVGAGTIHFLDFTTGGWTSVRAPNDHRLLQISPNPNGSIGILTSPGGGLGGVFAGLYLTRDDGKSWQEVKTEFKVKAAAVRETPKGTLLVPGGVFGDAELHASRDGGVTWHKASEFRLDRTLFAMPSGALLAVERGQFGLFSVRHSADEGVTWRNEYSNFDKSAHEAEQKAKK